MIINKIKRTLVAGLIASFVAPVFLQAEEPQVVRHPQLGTVVHFHQNVFKPRWNVAKVMPLIAESGLTWIRDEISWQQLEEEKGVYVIPERELEWINAANEAGLKVLLLFNTRGNKLYDNVYDPDAYAAAAAWLAKELKGKIHAMEIMNEPFNFRGMGTVFGGTWNGKEPDGSTSPWVYEYVKLLNATAKAVKAVNPELTIVGLGAEAPANFRMLEIGIAPEVDAIAEHPYSRRVIPELVLYAATDGILERDGIATADKRGTYASQIGMYRERSERFKGPKDIWITETGFTTYSGVDRQLHAGFTEEAQAKYLQRRLVEALGLGVEVIMQYDFMDDGNDPNRAQHHFGLVDFDLNPKPSLGAVKRVSQAMATLTPKETMKVYLYPYTDRLEEWPIVWDGTRIASYGEMPIHQFVDEDGTPVIALWSAERAGGDMQPRNADLELISDTPINWLRVHNLWTGQTHTVSVKKSGNNIYRAERLVVPDAPLLLTPVASADDLGNPMAKEAAVEVDRSRPLFSSGRTWRFNEGREFPGASGKIVRLADGEVQLDYDFSDGGRYVTMDTQITAANNPGKEIRFRVKADHPLPMILRLIDSTGQTFQIRSPYNRPGAWQPFRVNLESFRAQSWGGAADKKFHFPLKSLRIGVNRPADGKPAGEVIFANP